MTVPGLAGRLLSQSFVLSLNPVDPMDPAIGAHRSWVVAHGRALKELGPVSTPRAILERVAGPLLRALGFGAIDDVEASGSALVCTARAPGGIGVVIVSTWAERLDGFWRVGVQAARQRGAAWCFLFNGPEMRIVDASRLYSRRFTAFDLTAAQEQPATGAVLWRVASAMAVCARDDEPGSLGAMVTASDRLSAAVCRSLREGVLEASREALSALLARDPLPGTRVDDAFQQALTVVYRMLFLLFAEARSLVPIWNSIYRESYSIESLRDAAEHSEYTPGLWDALRAIARLAHAGCSAGDLTVSPFNGRLFSPAQTPLAERRGLDDRAARRALLALSSRPTTDRSGFERIVYRDLGVEELGAVYETLLDYQPRTSSPAQGRRSRCRVVTLEPGSGVRKATGTFYTPQPIAEYLVRTTLAPLVRQAPPEAILNLRVLDMAMGSGAFLVAACRYLADAYERATILAGACRPHDITDGDRAIFRQMIAERCLYGVDVNPMAVQLARLSLWLTTLSAGRPLSFLDHRLVAGDSLLGTWLTHLRRPPNHTRRPRLASLPLLDDQLADGALKNVLPLRFSLEAMPNDTIEQVRAKERAFAGLARDERVALWKRVANLWCSAWFAEREPRALSRVFRSVADDVLAGFRTLNAEAVETFLKQSDEAARAHRFLHWELEFPEVFFDRSGHRLARPGFDAVIGNPPWDMLRADQGEPDARAHNRRTVASTIRFSRDSGLYSAQSAGHANRYQLFLERTLDLTRPGGRFGLVLPSGLAVDHGSAALRRLLFSRCDVDGIIGLDNHRRIFPIHRSVRFLLLTATAGGPTSHLRGRFGVDSLSGLETAPGDDRPAFPIQFPIETLSRLSGDGLAIPYLRSRTDLEIVERAATLFAPLGGPSGWGARFGRELNATDDRDAFHGGRAGVPVVDGRHVHPFQVTTSRVERRIRMADLGRRIDTSRIGRARLGYRDVAGATNRVTLIAAILPAGCVCTHTVFSLRTALRPADQHLLCGFFNSLVVNYLVRLRVSTHVTTAIVEWLPVPTRSAAPATCRTLAALARRLSRRHDAADSARLNAFVARLYQLTADEFAHVLDSFPLIDRADRDAAHACFRNLYGAVTNAD